MEWTGYIRGVVGQVQEKSHTFQTAVLLEISGEESSGFQIYTHSSENNGEVVLMSIMCALIRYALLLNQTSLSTNLGSNFVMWETGSREDGNLLSTSNRVHGIDGRDTSRDHLFRVDLKT